jgi:hypothetical protein
MGVLLAIALKKHSECGLVPGTLARLASVLLAMGLYRVLHDCARQEGRLSSKRDGLAAGQKDVPSSSSRQVKLLLIHAVAFAGEVSH